MNNLTERLHFERNEQNHGKLPVEEGVHSSQPGCYLEGRLMNPRSLYQAHVAFAEDQNEPSDRYEGCCRNDSNDSKTLEEEKTKTKSSKGMSKSREAQDTMASKKRETKDRRARRRNAQKAIQGTQARVPKFTKKKTPTPKRMAKKKRAVEQAMVLGDGHGVDGSALLDDEPPSY
ncbi:hypothetical protein N0V83_001237 [Neocucurbitaria cava]|uniref:Uncharacterized protein n=1 Tax=Neocucurbitaria cava TaxID=798079 RepID=A0A9W8YFU0_9PLEO|nr:hypothetical protein N0V83_001237 [Neocucurbitaria cava]